MQDTSELHLFLRHAQDAGVASFDVFDTCIWRRVAQPTHVFAFVEQRVALVRGDAEADGFGEARVAAERAARDDGRRDRGAVETTLDEIYAALPRFWRRDASALEEARRLEMEVELDLIEPEPAIHDVYTRLKKAGVRTIFVSDVYLGREQLRALLARCGYGDDDPIFVSSECNRAKWNGSIWPLVARTLDVELHRIVHIGDNARVDVQMARNAGLNAYFWPGRSAEHKPVTPVSRKTLPLTILKSASQSLVKEGDAASSWSRLGKTYGPLIYGSFLLWLKEQVWGRVDHIYFCARDGQIVERLWRELIDPSDSGPAFSYLHVSRRTLNLPWVSRLDGQAIDFLLSGREPRSVSALLDRAGLSASPRAAARALERFGSLDRRVENPQDRDSVRDFFHECEADLSEAAFHHRALAERYLEQEGLFAGGRRVIVDLGWRGSLQRSLREFIEARDAATLVSGLYMGLTREAGVNRGATGWMTAMTVNDFMSEQSDFALRQMVSVLEFLHSADHGTTWTYAEENGRIIPVFRSNAIEDTGFRSKVGPFQEAARVELRRIFGGDHMLGPNDLTPESAWAALIDLCLYPSSSEAQLIGQALYMDGFEHSGDGVPIAAPLLSPTREAAEAALNAHTWIPGTLRNWIEEHPEMQSMIRELAGKHSSDAQWLSQYP